MSGPDAGRRFFEGGYFAVVGVLGGFAAGVFLGPGFDVAVFVEEEGDAEEFVIAVPPPLV